MIAVRDEGYAARCNGRRTLVGDLGPELTDAEIEVITRQRAQSVIVAYLNELGDGLRRSATGPTRRGCPWRSCGS